MIGKIEVESLLGADSHTEPSPAQRKAREWLPEAMLFPAVDSSTTPEPDVGDDPDADDSLEEEPVDEAA